MFSGTGALFLNLLLIKITPPQVFKHPVGHQVFNRLPFLYAAANIVWKRFASGVLQTDVLVDGFPVRPIRRLAVDKRRCHKSLSISS